MHAAGVVITLARDRRVRRALLVTFAALVLSGVVILASIVATVRQVLATTCETTGGVPGPGSSTYVSQEPSREALADIPENYLAAYEAAGEQYGLDWAVIAGIGKVESDHGRAEPGCEMGPPTPYGQATGPMQFLTSTWQGVGVDANGDAEAEPCDFEDAIHSAANYLKQAGAPEDYEGAIYTYNHSQQYVDDVLAHAERYRSAAAGQEEDAGAPQNASTGDPAPATAAAGPATAAAHPASGGGSGSPPQGWDLVDESRHVHYELDTRYGDYFEEAAEDWSSLGGVSIEPSPSPEETDLVVTDGSLNGAMAQATSDGYLTYDRAYMDGATENARGAVSAHEIGHVLGFEHVEQESVMNTPIVTNGTHNNDELTPYDESVYRDTWGGSSGASGGGSLDGSAVEGSTKAVFPLGERYMDSYSDDWGAQRPQGGHEGTDIMAPKGEPIYSITDGIVRETAGSSASHYSELGGYNIMVEATSDVGPIKAGDLLYYAHMRAPGPSVEAGQRVSAGERIGAVGDTGYGPEVTTGEFPPHLHLGWYDPTGQRAEVASGAMNPYPLLEWLKQHGGTATGVSGLAPGPSGEESPAYCSGPVSKLFGFFTPGAAGDSSISDESGATAAPEVNGSSTSGSDAGEQVVEEAKKYLGTPYVLAGPQGCIPHEQMDCTCLTTTVFEEFGLSLPDNPTALMDYGEPVDGEPQAGDVLVWADPGDGTGGHVAIAVGDGRIIHANMATMDTSISPMYDSPRYLGARRLIE